MPDVHYRLALTYMHMGRADRAVGPLMKAIKLTPDAPEPMAKLAWILATHPDPKLRSVKDALFLATRASELTQNNNAQVLQSLAAAQAANEQFDQAATTADHAIAITSQSKDAALSAQLTSDANRYRAHQPITDTTLAGADPSDALR